MADSGQVPVQLLVSKLDARNPGRTLASVCNLGMVRASGAMAAALFVLGGCERSEPRRSAGTGIDSVPAVRPNDERPAPAQPPGSRPSADLREALEQLLRGPTAQQQAGDRHSWFSAETAGALRSVTVDSTGHATVEFRDLRPLIPNASSSAGSASLLAELDSAVFQFPGIRSVEYRMEGSCDLFWEWLQYGCHRVMRDSTIVSRVRG
jgi:hypothetical protein